MGVVPGPAAVLIFQSRLAAVCSCQPAKGVAEAAIFPHDHDDMLDPDLLGFGNDADRANGSLPSSDPAATAPDVPATPRKKSLR